MTPTDVVLLVAGAALTAAAFAVVVRLVRGPTILDRVVALDVLVVVLVSSFGLYAVVTDTTTVLPILVVFALVGFVGAVSIARFAARESR